MPTQNPPVDIQPKLKWAWHGSDSDRSTVNVYGPVVAGHLTDDNGDGSYDSRIFQPLFLQLQVMEMP